MKELSFKPAKITVQEFLSMPDSKLQAFYEKVSRKNEKWLEGYLANHINWVIIRGNKPGEGGYSEDERPSFDSLRINTIKDGKVNYLLYIPQAAIKDLEIFFQTKEREFFIIAAF